MDIIKKKIIKIKSIDSISKNLLILRKDLLKKIIEFKTNSYDY